MLNVIYAPFKILEYLLFHLVFRQKLVINTVFYLIILRKISFIYFFFFVSIMANLICELSQNFGTQFFPITFRQKIVINYVSYLIIGGYVFLSFQMVIKAVSYTIILMRIYFSFFLFVASIILNVISESFCKMRLSMLSTRFLVVFASIWDQTFKIAALSWSAG